MMPDAYLIVRYKYTTVLDTVVPSVDRVDVVESVLNWDRVVSPAGRIIAITYDVLRSPVASHTKRNLADRHPEYITVGDWRFRVVDYDIMRDALLCSVDSPLGWFTAVRYKTDQVLRILKVRLIATAAVWGLAKWHWGDASTLPVWRDIYAVDWLYKKLKGVKV